MVKNILFLIGLITLSTSCNSDDFDLNPKYPDVFINTWLESREEGIGIYRPADYKSFPASWYRQSFKFMNNNVCEYLMPSPVDAHYIEKGSWEYIERDKVINIYNPDKELIRKLKVVSISSELLRVE